MEANQTSRTHWVKVNYPGNGRGSLVNCDITLLTVFRGACNGYAGFCENGKLIEPQAGLHTPMPGVSSRAILSPDNTAYLLDTFLGWPRAGRVIVHKSEADQRG